MSRLSEEIGKIIENNIVILGETYEIQDSIKRTARYIADEIRIDTEEVKKAIICGLQEDSYDRKGVREYRGCTVLQISKAINKDCIVIGGKK